MRISKQAMSIMQSCAIDTFERVASEASRLTRMKKQTKDPTLGTREVQSAVRLVLPGEICRHAVSQ